MSTSPFADEEVMEDYMSALLTEQPQIKEVRQNNVEQLLRAVPTPRSELFKTIADEDLQSPPILTKVVKSEVERDISPVVKSEDGPLHVIPTENFQVLLFEVAGMMLAVPLTELGGIHKFESISQLFGKPLWFDGVMIIRDEKYSVVDTIRWLMPEKSIEKVAESTKYQYLIVLGDSQWGLSCESLINNVTLSPEDVKWRSIKGSRPWVSGMVKKKMCALVNVNQLINMLDQGLSCNDLPDSGRSDLNE